MTMADSPPPASTTRHHSKPSKENRPHSTTTTTTTTTRTLQINRAAKPSSSSSTGYIDSEVPLRIAKDTNPGTKLSSSMRRTFGNEMNGSSGTRVVRGKERREGDGRSDVF